MGVIAFMLMCSNGMANTVIDFNAARDFTRRTADIGNTDEHTLSWNDSSPLVEGTEGITGNMNIHGGFSGQGDVEGLQIEYKPGRNTIAFSVVNAKTTTSKVKGQIILFWDSAAFLAPGHKFDASTACSFSLVYNTCANHEGTRFVIRDGSRYFLSSDAGVSATGGNINGSTAGLKWAAFDPAAFQSFDGTSGRLGLTGLGPFSTMTFDDVTGVGFIASANRSNGVDLMLQLEDFRVELAEEVNALGLVL